MWCDGAVSAYQRTAGFGATNEELQLPRAGARWQYGK